MSTVKSSLTQAMLMLAISALAFATESHQNGAMASLKAGRKPAPQLQQTAGKKPPKSVKGLMQKRPGGPLEQVEVAVHAVPVNPKTVEASKAPLSDADLVLGVVVDGKAVAYPVRYLALYEIIDDRVGDMPIAASW